MARVGIMIDRALGVSIPNCRRLAQRHRGDHALALDLWGTRIHEARILASMVDDPSQVGVEQMEGWAADFDSWDLCDQVCGNLFTATPLAFDRAHAWVRRDHEFVKRAGFSIVATHAARASDDHDDAFWLGWLPEIERATTDERNYVKKAVNWALRQIGKRDLTLNSTAIETGERLAASPSRSARWIGRDALRELRSDAVQARVRA
jgi:3-methyladenine DNA glycosylase AlkD